jgi:hypothetical protein
MKSLPSSHSLRGAVLFAASLLGVISARAAAPTVSLTVDSFYLGSAVIFSPTVADADADMDYVTFAVAGPTPSSSWSTLSPDVNVPGAGTAAQQNGVSVAKSWTPSLPGLWTVCVTVHSLNGSTSVNRSFDVLAGTRTLNPLTVPNGSNQIYTYAGELVTATDTSTSTTNVESGGNLILWSGGRVKLEPGFHAKEGSFFWAAVDHDMNGYSDQEELQQNFISGVPDAWLVDQGINLSTPMNTWGYTAAQLLAAYQGGYKATDIANASKTTTFALILTTPSGTYGVQPGSNWAISCL